MDIVSVGLMDFGTAEISTQADGAQSPRVPVPFPKDPYEAIRQAYLVRTDTESEPFEDPIETEVPESPHIVAPPTSLPDSTPPTLVPILRRTTCMAMCVSPAMSPGLSTSIAEVAAMFDSAFRKRFRSSYESSPSSSPPDLPLRKRYRGTSKLVEENDEEEDDKEEDEKSLDSDCKSEDAKDEGPTVEDEDLVSGDEGLAARDEGPDTRVESLGLGLDVVVPEGQQHAASVVKTAMGQSSGSVPEPKRHERVSALRQPTLTTWIDPEDGAVKDEIFSQRYRFRSLEHEQERVAVTFREIWRPVLVPKSWAEEMHERLDLAEIVNSMRRGQEPRGDV
nr:hypothetical protein [Tanacetum cinerariifolium]